MSPEERRLQELIAAARAQKAGDSTLGKDLQTVVEVAEVLATMLAITVLEDPPVLATVTATLNPHRPKLVGFLRLAQRWLPRLSASPRRAS